MIKTLYRHMKTGGLYELLMPMGRVQSDDPLKDMDPVAIYRSQKDGTLWARRASEFDSRFGKTDIPIPRSLSPDGIAGELYVVKNELEHLKAKLASIGPRPISEADPTKEEQNYYTWNPYWKTFSSIAYYGGSKRWATSVFSDFKVTHFYDLDQLEKPEVE